MFVRHFRLNHV